MNTRGLKQIGFVFILIAILVVTFGTENISYAQEAAPTLTASVEAPLTEATLHESVVTLTLSGRSFVRWEPDIEEALTISSIEGEGVPFGSWDVDRVSDTQITVELEFAGDIDTDTPLVFTVGANAIEDYEGAALTAELPVTAVEESLVASTESPLNEATLHGSVVTLTLSGRSFVGWESDIADALTVTGIDGVTLTSSSFWERVEVDWVSNTQIRIELSFDGTDFDTDATLTFTIGAAGIAGYGESLTAQLPVTVVKQSNATISLSPNPVVSPPLGEKFTIDLNITGGENVAGFQATVHYNNSTLQYMGSTQGDYLPADAFFGSSNNDDVTEQWESVRDTIFGNLSDDNVFLVGQYTRLIQDTHFPFSELNPGFVSFAATALEGVSNGNGRLATLTFEVINVGNVVDIQADIRAWLALGNYDTNDATITLSDVYLVDRQGIRWEVEIEGTEIVEPEHDIVGDLNRDGVVNIQDLVLMISSVSVGWWRIEDERLDLNGDGILDIADLVLLANAIGEDAAAPALNPEILEHLTAADVKRWLTQAQQLTRTDPAYLRSVDILEQLLAALTPKATALLANYPNPFNPETWIPYQLAKSAEVMLTIYSVDGVLVRTLALGHQPPGRYQSRSRAAYWDGQNDAGEPVASGVYFYTLTAGEFSATRKMLIRK